MTTPRTLWLDFWYGIRNLIAYLPVIWKQRDWDYAYLLRLMEFKLRRMAKVQTQHEGCENHQQEMIVVAGLCKVLAEEEAWMNEDEVARLLGNVFGENVLYWWN